MRRTFWIYLVVAGWLSAPAGAQSPAVAGTTQPRLTVFEGFYNPGCTVCQAAGTAVDQLATQYASQPVVFLEDNLSAPKGERMSRFTAVGDGYYYPYIMVNSGHAGQSWTEGSQADNAAYVAKYKSMVDVEMARPALVEMNVYQRRVDDTVRIYAEVVNTTSVTLSPSAFPTWVHGIVWEDTKALDTNRYVRAAMVAPVSGLAPGARGGFTLESPALTGVAWDKVHALALVDYKPGGYTGSIYDMMQAAHAQPAAFAASSSQLSFTFPGGTPVAEIRFTGPYVLQWTATSSQPWLAVSPATGGALATPAQVTVDPNRLVFGEQTGTITFTATSSDGMSFTSQVQVTATQTQPPHIQELPGVASAPGSGSTVWRSSMVLSNPGTDPVTAKLEILPRDSAVVVASKELQLAAGEVKPITDLYQELTAPSGTGNLRITGRVLAWVRTFNQGATGTFGQDLVGTEEVTYASGETLLFPISTAVNLATEYRSNLLLLNLEDTPIDVTLRSGDRSKVITVPARTYTQLDKVGRQQLGLPAGTSVMRVQATGKWVGYVSTVDPVTGDPTTVRGQKPLTP
ncbi:MAG TPA: hypothetical protein PLS53_05435 [Thermoanaerobaculaceae bacterium]|nr:hypothetical protein [Thermoanaerobaculaceae bacterium]HPS77580.1 hypothetical protein [Thermoanaerobaculaceae bacterium]